MNNFPTIDQLEFLKSMNALTQSQVDLYYHGKDITADQVRQLGFTVPVTKTAPKVTPQSSSVAPSAKPTQPAKSSVAPNSNSANSAKPSSSSVTPTVNN